MTDESQLQVRSKEDELALVLSSAQSSLIARGRRDAEVIARQQTPDLVDPLAETRRLAEEGDRHQQYELGLAYYEGHDSRCSPPGSTVPRDYAEALDWFRKAADQFHIDSNSILGDMYERGEGVPADQTEALRYYVRAADIAIACLESGVNGRGDASQPEWLWDWDPDSVTGAISQAAEHGYAKAQHLLGELYFVGCVCLHEGRSPN